MPVIAIAVNNTNKMATKYKGIDERQIKCCDNADNTIEAGISFEQLENGTNVLRFHFLDMIAGKVLDQRTKTMFGMRQTIELLHEKLKIEGFDV